MDPAYAGRHNLLPAWDRLVTEGIKPVDDKHLVFYEPVTWGYVMDNAVYRWWLPRGPLKVVVQRNATCHAYADECSCWEGGRRGRGKGQVRGWVGGW